VLIGLEGVIPGPGVFWFSIRRPGPRTRPVESTADVREHFLTDNADVRGFSSVFVRVRVREIGRDLPPVRGLGRVRGLVRVRVRYDFPNGRSALHSLLNF
jgi:hypothetical protein